MLHTHLESSAAVWRDEASTPIATAWREVVRIRHDEAAREDDEVIAEVPVALVYNRISHAVMMASPADLEDFAIGFSLGEGIVEHAHEIHALDIQTHGQGVVLNMVIAARRFAVIKERRRHLAGRSGCGLCGIDSLDTLSAHATGVRVDAARRLSVAAIDEALRQLPHLQPLRNRTGASHAAAWVDGQGRILSLREDVGRHNALDKLLGALARTGQPLEEGFALITSRASYEMVQKAARFGISSLVAVSAPTSYAIEQAEAAGILLVGFARAGQRVAYSHAERLDLTPQAATHPSAIM